jgi:hypothetical protein
MTRILGRDVLPFVRRRLSFVVIVRSAMLMSLEKIKKVLKQRRSKRIGLGGKAFLVANAEFKILLHKRGLKPMRFLLPLSFLCKPWSTHQCPACRPYHLLTLRERQSNASTIKATLTHLRIR